MKPFSIIVAVDQENGIGKDGNLPWHLKADLKHFKEITTKTNDPQKVNAVIMGRKTWDSLPPAFRPLPGRFNVVITRASDLEFPPEVLKANGFPQAFALLEQQKIKETIESVYVIGGAQIFNEAIRYPECQKIYLTKIFQSFHCDTFFPPFEAIFKEVSVSSKQTENGIPYVFAEYTSFLDIP